MKRRNIFGEYNEKPRQPFSEKFAIPILSTSAEAKKLKLREQCLHEQWEKVHTDNLHWRKVCLICSKQFASEVTDNTEGEEIFL